MNVNHRPRSPLVCRRVPNDTFGIAWLDIGFLAGDHFIPDSQPLRCQDVGLLTIFVLDEGNERGPTLSLRGIDNASYYRLLPHNRRFYQDFTGCGNTLNMQTPRVLQLIMDSLRYWVQEMHVDGFRFDLASALARELHDVDKLSAFFDIILQDPVLSEV